TIANDLVAAAAELDPNLSNNTASVTIPVAPLPAATTTTLVAIPNPAVAGQPVTFTARVAPAAPQDGPTGVVTFFIDGVGHAASVVPSADGPTGTATYTATFPTAGTHGVVALYSGDANFAPSVSTSIIEGVNPAPPAGPAPRVVEVLRYGYHALPTELVVEFNEPLDAASAQDPGNYAIAGPPGRPIAVVSASLAPGGTAVVLRPSGRLNVHEIYTLTVAGGVKCVTGVPMGSEQVALVTLRDLVWRQAMPASRARPSAHAVDALLAAEYRASLTASAALGPRR
ncbi:MAG TPA: Ig-like domain repeat protein, partial [Isosphaeraceae bacterium]